MKTYGTFYIAKLYNCGRDRIGFGVYSPSRFGDRRMHYETQGNGSLERCEKRRRELQFDADRSRATQRRQSNESMGN